MSAKRAKLDEESADDDIVHLNLEGFSPQSVDRDGIIQLLRQLFPKEANLHLGALADHIISQGSVGTVVKNETIDTLDTEADDDDEDIVFSLTTIVSLCQSAVNRSSIVSDLRCFLNSFISRASSSNPDYKTLLNVVMAKASEKPALLINERFVNLPPIIAAEAVAALPNEVQNLPEEERPTHLIILTKAIKSEGSEELLYVQPEMELVRRVAFAVIETNVVNVVPDGDTETITYVVMGVDFSSLPEILDLLSANP